MRVHIALDDDLVAELDLTHDAALCTGNVRDFPMPGVRVDHWPAGQ